MSAMDTSGTRMALDQPRAEEPPQELMFRRRVSPLGALRELLAYRGIVATLAERDLRSRAKQAALGAAWALLTPLMLMLVFAIVFTRFATFDSGGVPSPLFSYLGLIPWTFFSTAVSTGGNRRLSNVSLL